MCAAVGLCNCSFSRVQRQVPRTIQHSMGCWAHLELFLSLCLSLRMVDMGKTSKHPSLLLLHLSGYSPLHLSSSGFHSIRLCFAVTGLSTIVEIAKLEHLFIVFVSGVSFCLRWKSDLNGFDCHGPFQKCAGQLKIKNFNDNEHLIFISGRCQ